MIHPTLKERLFHKIELKTNWLFASARRKRLNNIDFSIISNNCWGGICYEYFGLQKLSPTVGCYFFANDYIKFISRLEYYLKQELRFIPLNQSKYSKEISEFGETNKENLTAPIGLLDDVEIVFLHYKNQLKAYEKWNRRIKRINYNNLIFKFSHQNNCTEEHIKTFNQLDLPGKKICFSKTYIPLSSNIYINGYENEDNLQDSFCWRKNYDLVEFINTGIIKRK